MIGQELAHYRIEAKLGKGGMGEVYLAHDAQLNRKVALKVLPPETAASQERLERFRREARTLASLNHPNIVTVHSIESAGGIHFLTMELLEGQTLSGYIPEGGVDLAEFFRIAIALADALAAAHDGGLIHRDLKPSNIFVTQTGTIKILDFGLAKLNPSAVAPIDTEAPTDSLTDEHRVLGTVPYMAPEQLQGRPIDHRADIFALGIVLYQLATGDRPFQGTTSVEVASAILRDTPTPANELKAELPHHIGRVISLCLEKDRERRLQSVKDLRNELALLRREIESGKTEEMLPQPARRPFAWRRWAALALLPIAVLVGVWLTHLLPEREITRSMRIPMAPPPGLRPSLGFGPSVAISANGETLCYVMESGTTTRLYVKELQAFEARELPGTEGARSPAFSPSGEWIVFFDEDDRLLKKIALSGGQPIALTEADGQWGLTWASDETIVFTSTYSGLMKVDAGGGSPEPLIPAGRMQHFWPRIIPGTDTVLFSILPARGSFEDADIAVVPLGGGTPKVVLESGYYPHYSPTGHLVFVQGESVLAVPFDHSRLEVTGSAATVLEEVWASSWTGYADFAFSDNGTVVYVSGGPDPTRAKLVSVDRTGQVTPLVQERRPYRLPRLSPDGREIALTIVDEQVDVWTFNLERASFSRRTDSPSWEGYPQWHPSGRLLALSSMREGLAATYVKDLAANTIRRLFPSEHPTYPRSWSPDGVLLAYDEENPETGRDIRIYSADTDMTEAFLASRYNEWAAQFSPDGRYIAYQSDETGQQVEVYVRPYPQLNPRQKISTGGGLAPRWSRDGTELFYLQPGSLMAVPIETGDQLIAGTPVELFRGDFGHSYDVAPDGQSFLMLQELVGGDPPLRINMITDWLDELD